MISTAFYMVEFLSSQKNVASDIVAVTKSIESTGSEAFRIAKPLIRAALSEHGFVATSLIMLGARALGADESVVARLRAFAGAIELIHASLSCHARLPDGHGASRTSGLLSWGPSAGVLLGDCLYTRAFEMISHTGDLSGMREIAALTERMVIACTLERYATAGDRTSPRPLVEVVWGASCALASTMSGGTDRQRTALSEFGELCGRLRLMPPRIVSSELAGEPGDSDNHSARRKYAERAVDLLSQSLPVSVFRSDLEMFAVYLEARM